ncbi:ATP-binding protein [Kiloniella sp. b19]|uniref:ATP-binding protein n=1 Tax=Kiloniella sp. GXU_MW_B19 TaxID=3141326 RepID=UPI0031E39B45
MQSRFLKSISGKLLSVYVPLISFSLLLLFAVLESRNIRKLNSELTERLDKMVAVQSTSLATPVWNYDIRSIESILLALSRNPEFYSATVYDVDGQVLSEKPADNIDRYEDANKLVKTAPINHQAFGQTEAIGSVKVSFHDSLIREEIQERLIFDALVIAVTVMVLSCLTLLATNTFIGRPLRMLLSSIEIEKQHKNRQPVEWSSNDELGTVVSAYNDLLAKQSEYETAVKRSEMRAKRSEAQLSQAIETMSEGFAVYDQNEMLVLCNNNYRNLSENRSRVITIGTPFMTIMRKLIEMGDFIGVDDPEEYLQNLHKIHSQSHETMIIQLSNGKWLQMTHRQTPGGETVVIATDISALKLQEREIRLAKETADQANQAKSRFLANMSHELRTPLNAILGFSEIMKKEMMGALGSEYYKSYASDIHSSGTHLLSLINDILDLSKIEAGAFELTDEMIDIINEARAAVNLVTGQATANKVEVAFEIACPRPCLMADLRAVKQIFLNLLSNAVKFTPEGGRVTFRQWKNEDGEIMIQVADTGIGISKHELNKVMEPFMRADTPMTRTFEGTGLGLPLAKSLMTQHDGSLEIESQVGQGTTVTLTFPAERCIPGPIEAVEEGSSVSA